MIWAPPDVSWITERGRAWEPWLREHGPQLDFTVDRQPDMGEPVAEEVPVATERRRLLGLDIPSSLSHLVRTVEESHWIVDLPDNWDDAGSPRFSEQTWERAVRFVLENALRLWYDRGRIAEAPVIHPGPDGSIDIHWQTEGRILLVNVPADKEVPAEYYGRDPKGHEIKGTLDTASANEWLMMWWSS